MDKEINSTLSSSSSSKGHVLYLPYPAQGHINPILQFAKRLSSKGFKATLATTVYLHKTIHLNNCNVEIETISDRYEESGQGGANSFEVYVTTFKEVGSRSLECLIKKYNNSTWNTTPDYEPITGLVCDSLLSWGLDVGKNLGLVTASFYTQPCGVSSIFYHVKQGHLNVPYKEPTLSLPGLPLLATQDLPSSVLSIGQPYPTALYLLVAQFENLKQADWLLFNSFNDLENEEKSRVGKERQEKNKHSHYLGSGGYASQRQKWMISDPISSESSCASINVVTDSIMAFDWVRAITKKKEDGEHYIPNKKTKELLEKMVEMVDEVNKGTFQPKRKFDVLSLALGKEDHPGYVRGAGVYATVQSVYGKLERRKLSDHVSTEIVKELLTKCRDEIIKEVQPMIKSVSEQVQWLMKNMPMNMLPPIFPNDASKVLVGSQQSVKNVTPHVQGSDDPHVFKEIESPKPCHLSLCPAETPFVVAKGMAHPSTPSTLVHNVSLVKNHLKVTVDEIVDGAEGHPLSCHQTTIPPWERLWEASPNGLCI